MKETNTETNADRVDKQMEDISDVLTKLHDPSFVNWSDKTIIRSTTFNLHK